MEKIELKHLAPYLPYGLKGYLDYDAKEDFGYLMDDLDLDDKMFEKGAIWDFIGWADSDYSIPLGEGEIKGFIMGSDNTYTDLECKPILRPLSDLTKNEFVEDLGEWIGEYQELDFEQIEYGIVANYFKHHFDVFGLIDKGLAIDINTLKQTT